MSRPLNVKPSRARGRSNALEPAATPTPLPSRDAYKKALYVLPVSDLAWITDEIDRHRKATKIRLTKSDVVHIALEYLRKRGGVTQAQKEISQG